MYTIVYNSGTSCLKMFVGISFVWKFNGSGIFSLRVQNEKQPFAKTIKKGTNAIYYFKNISNTIYPYPNNLCIKYYTQSLPFCLTQLTFDCFPFLSRTSRKFHCYITRYRRLYSTINSFIRWHFTFIPVYGTRFIPLLSDFSVFCKTKR